MLDPKLELIRLARPFMRRIRLERMRPGRLAEEIARTGSGYLQLVRELPEELRSILRQLRGGRMRIEFEHHGLQALGAALDRVSNRIAFAIVLAALIVGSSLIVLSDIPPHWHDIPVIGLLGFLVAGIMGFWLLLSIIRHGRM
jgi:ubiquinone biosynthesis protein